MKPLLRGKTGHRRPLSRGLSIVDLPSDESSRFKRWWHLWWRYDYHLKIKTRWVRYPPRRPHKLSSCCGCLLKKIATSASGDSVSRPRGWQSVRRRQRFDQPRVRSMSTQRGDHNLRRRSRWTPQRVTERRRCRSPDASSTGLCVESGFGEGST